MNKTATGFLLASLLSAAPATIPGKRVSAYVPFADVPIGCGSPPPYYDMTPFKVTNGGLVVGGTRHSGECNAGGFVRSTSGTVTNIVDPAVWGTGPSTIVTGMNADGYVVGYGSSGSTHFPDYEWYAPFVMAPDGTFTMLSTGLAPIDINSARTIVGGVVATNNVIQGFLLDKKGALTYFGAPGTPGINRGGTYPVAINDVGTVTGVFQGADGVHGFVRAANGTFSMFDVKGATAINPAGMNQIGEVTGTYTDANALLHGFIRDARGQIVTFDVPGASPTIPYAINLTGEVSGGYLDSDGMHGFVRSADGVFLRIDYPDLPPPVGTCLACIGTVVTGINDMGEAVGFFNNLNGTHGFSVDTRLLGDAPKLRTAR